VQRLCLAEKPANHLLALIASLVTANFSARAKKLSSGP
jgi:hypothetical protein